ncbi:hypothetical protein FM115_08270 [Marinilactibacillus psychrotolerans 42ea]|uniref:Uncharacterized protein n=1 Tax=Marinilactibacillus psychrotolerans 42ea TaxID=1255609 RepID=A0A1R4K6B9_9LACT|nr:hypothetical protein [Marinilactibacillus psychrotolerans]SJN39655.1 hypothetical protein FM115_08270 [Marinilactibacillus psychrotolerans 42ea]
MRKKGRALWYEETLIGDYFQNDQLNKLNELNINGFSGKEIFKTNQVMLETI